MAAIPSASTGAHRLDGADVVNRDAVAAGEAGERIGDERPAALVGVDQVFVCQPG